MKLNNLVSGFAFVLVAIALTAPTPASAQVVVVGSTVQESEIPPGGQYTGTIRLRNTSDATQEVRIHQTDYSFGAAGENHFSEAGTSPRSNARWISFTPSQASLGPREETTVSYTVTSPAPDADPSGESLRGTYWSILMVEGVQASPDTTELSDGQFGIRPRVRFAVQLVSHIEGPSSRVVDLDEVRVTTAPTGERSFSIDVVNTGERAYRPRIQLHLYTLEGDPMEVLGEQRGLLYPHTGLRQTFDVSDVPAGSYEALITVDTGGADLFGTQVRVTL